MDFNSVREEIENLIFRVHQENEETDLTIGYEYDPEEREMDWDYQTGDNSSSGGAYRFSHWITIRVNDMTDWVRESFDAMSEIIQRLSEDGHDFLPLTWKIDGGCGRANTLDLHPTCYRTVKEEFNKNNIYEQVGIEFFVTGNTGYIELSNEEVALVAKVTELLYETKDSAPDRIVTHHYLGSFSETITNQNVCVSRIMRYAEFAFSCFKEDGHFAGCPSSEQMTWVDSNFNLIPQQSLADPDIGGVW